MSGTREQPREAGIIVGEATSSEFYFASKVEEYPSKWEYLIVPSKEIIDGEQREVPVLAQVEKIVTASQALTSQTDIEALMRIKAAELQDIRTWGKARILGYLHKDQKGSSTILLPRRAVVPGNPIYVAPANMLKEFYSYPTNEGLHIGALITRPDVPVHLTVSGFRRHLAIIAQTGAGKSYCAGILIEELLKKGATVVVIDPHADYAFLSLTQDGGRYEMSERITTFRNPASTGRYGDRKVGNVRPYQIAFSDLEYEQVCEVAGIRRGWTNIREAVRLSLEALKNTERYYSLNDLITALDRLKDSKEEEINRTVKSGAASAVKYIRSLRYLQVFGVSSTPISEILKPVHVSVIDLSGLNDRSMDYISSRILEEVYDAASTGDFPYPVFIIVEEAHRLIPIEQTTFSAPIVNRIAAEGRKFGVFLILISQRPSKINPDSLSQCNSQIIMKLTNPHDQEAVAESSERISQDLLSDLPGLNPGEAVIVGEMTRAPVMIKVRQRKTMEGGADIDVVKKLAEGLRELTTEKITKSNQEKEIPYTGEYSKT